MAQIELIEQTAKLSHIQFHSKGKENDDKTIPLTLKFNFEASNDFLAHFHPRFRDAFYMIDDGGQQEQIDGGQQRKTKRVFADMLETISLGTKLEGAGGYIKYGADSRIPIETAKVKGFKVVLKEGSTISVEFQVIARFVSKHIKTLAELKENDIEITLGMNQGELPMGDE